MIEAVSIGGYCMETKIKAGMKKIKPFKERNSRSLLSSQYTVYRE